MTRCVLRRRAFRRFWLGMMISRAGDALTMVAQAWVVLGLAGPTQPSPARPWPG